MIALKEWPEQERPREKLLKFGSQSLSDAELIAILLRVGTKGKTAIDVARLLLKSHGSLRSIFNSSIDSLCQHQGVGQSKAVQLYAALELGQRLQKEKLLRQQSLTSPRDCEDYLKSWLSNKPYECFACIFLDNKNQVISCEELFRGTIDQVSVFPREVLRIALDKQSSAIIVAHNHPSGVAEPSSADVEITEKLNKSLKLLDIRLLDHLIVGEQGAVSLAERGYL